MMMLVDMAMVHSNVGVKVVMTSYGYYGSLLGYLGLLGWILARRPVPCMPCTSRLGPLDYYPVQQPCMANTLYMSEAHESQQQLRACPVCSR